MTNFEKYKDEILEIIANNQRVALKKGEHTLRVCEGFSCVNCVFNYPQSHNCNTNFANWLYDEYEETVDWSKVPVDTKVLVRNNVSGQWYKRYFAKYENEKVYVYPWGCTSWSADNKDDFVAFKNAKLADTEQF